MCVVCFDVGFSPFLTFRRRRLMCCDHVLQSFLLRHMVRELKRKHGSSAVYVTASTGIAACNVSGTTLHSFAGMFIRWYARQGRAFVRIFTLLMCVCLCVCRCRPRNGGRAQACRHGAPKPTHSRAVVQSQGACCRRGVNSRRRVFRKGKRRDLSATTYL